MDWQRMYEEGAADTMVIRQAGGGPPLLILELKPPSAWTVMGKAEVLETLGGYLEERLQGCSNSEMYGLGCIGLHWMVCKMRKTADGTAVVGPEIVHDWSDDISSDESFAAMESIAALIHNIQ